MWVSRICISYALFRYTPLLPCFWTSVVVDGNAGVRYSTCTHTSSNFMLLWISVAWPVPEGTTCTDFSEGINIHDTGTPGMFSLCQPSRLVPSKRTILSWAGGANDQVSLVVS